MLESFKSSLFYRLFGIPVPWEVVMAATVATFVVAAVVCGRRGKWEWKVLWRALLVEYVALVLYITVFHRTAGTEYRICLQPMWSIPAIKGGQIETVYEKVYNILLFLPLGILTALWDGKMPGGWRRMGRCVGLGLGLSVLVEVLQLVTKRGMCEVDDVICNTFGQALGVGIGMIGWQVKNGDFFCIFTRYVK